MRRTRRLIPAFLLMLLVAETSGDYVDSLRSDTLVIDGRSPSCRSCSLDAALVATIGSRSDAEVPQRVPTVLRDSRGMHYLVFDGWINKPILRYDSTGRYIAMLARPGYVARVTADDDGMFRTMVYRVTLLRGP